MLFGAGEYVLLFNPARRLFGGEPKDLYAELVQVPIEAQKQMLTAAFIQAKSLVVSEQYQRVSDSFRVPQDGGLNDDR